MPRHVQASHRIVVDAPVDRCFMFFTPAGEERWVAGWRPDYLHPADGRTEAGMVFTTGQGQEMTIWLLADFDRSAHRSRYVRCTPGSRTGTVEIRCQALEGDRTEVEVRYTLTALGAEGERPLEAFEGDAFAAMIEGWAREIEARRGELLAAVIP
ncbi:SRPBCC family protein [Ideonella sp. YS5]|uniref:SRPBCC family protein n=1 Tax=Ideonella sp. YS5 TaxID=3453714 RepID=UPI003EEEB705